MFAMNQFSPEGSGPSAPQPPVQPAFVAAPVAETAPKKKLNTLALVALIVAVIGFIFACVPGALIVGWILLPIAFVLSIVSLFLKGDKKWFGIIALVLSIVGTIVGFVVFFAGLASAVDDAFSSGDTSVTQPAEEAAPAEGEEAPAETGAAEGTRENPYPLGSTIANDDWTVVINSHNVDGAAAVAEGNMFNAPAPAGSHYEIVNATLTYTGADSAFSMEVSIDAVTSGGNVIGAYDSMATLADAFSIDEMYAGASVTGSVAFLVPDGETVTLRVTPGLFADEVFVQP